MKSNWLNSHWHLLRRTSIQAHGFKRCQELLFEYKVRKPLRHYRRRFTIHLFKFAKKMDSKYNYGFALGKHCWKSYTLGVNDGIEQSDEKPKKVNGNTH